MRQKQCQHESMNMEYENIIQRVGFHEYCFVGQPCYRWENTQALGSNRRNFAGSMPIADLLFFVLRQQSNNGREKQLLVS